MPLDSNKKLIKTIKENSYYYELKYNDHDIKFLKDSEKDLIKHLNRINTIFAELAFLRKQLGSLTDKKKLKAKDFKEKKELTEHLAFLEGDEIFLIEEKDRTRTILKAASKLIWDEFKVERNLPYSFEEIIDNERNLKFFLNEGIINTYNIRFVPRILGDNIKRVFPKNPKDEFSEARALKRTFFIHEGGTNSGKTYSSILRLMEAESGLYLAPLRLLALEIYDRLNAHNVPCNLKTGEEEIDVKFARHTSSTVEKADLSYEYEVVVIDEAQMLADSQRGAAWTRAILGVRAKEIHICCALYATDIVKTIIEDCGDEVEVITHIRDTELLVEDANFNFPSSVKEGDALIVFSRKSVLTIAAALEDKGINCSLIYGNLPPETRRMQFEKFLKKETKVLVSTDAIGMGVNLPIKRIIFLEHEKFDGVDIRPLLSSEVKQIAGRAGRKGIYEVGYVNTIHEGLKKLLKKMLICDETPIKKAYIAPTEDILKVAEADLEVKLKVWSALEPEVNFYEKINVDRLVELINIITILGIKHQLTSHELFKSINIPFDESEEELLHLWKEYLYALSSGKTNLLKPRYEEEELYSLEIYYRKVDLYYSFCKTFNFPMDELWVREERKKVAKLIDKYLKERIKKYRKVCKHCGRPLTWDYVYPICQVCYEAKFWGNPSKRKNYDFEEDDEDNFFNP
jgi:ATP-dependent RNA helicase SUPV3L1/SUV3